MAPVCVAGRWRDWFSLVGIVVGAVGVFVSTSLPGTVCGCEVHFDTGCAAELFMVGKFHAPVPGEGFHEVLGQIVEVFGEFIGQLCSGMRCTGFVGGHDITQEVIVHV